MAQFFGKNHQKSSNMFQERFPFCPWSTIQLVYSLASCQVLIGMEVVETTNKLIIYQTCEGAARPSTCIYQTLLPQGKMRGSYINSSFQTPQAC